MSNILGLNIVRTNLPADKVAIKATYPMDPQYVTIHNTANRASARNEIAYMYRNDNYTSYHIAVDDVEAIIAIPFNRNAWHCGDGNSGTGNRQSIGIEICHSTNSDANTYEKSEDNGAKIAAITLMEKGWGIDRLRKHQDWSGKYCPHRILDKPDGWNQFKQKVQGYLNQLKGTPQPETKSSTTQDTPPFSKGSTVKVKPTATHYYTRQFIASWVKNKQYTVLQSKEVNYSMSKYAYLLSGIMSWVLEQDLFLVNEPKKVEMVSEEGIFRPNRTVGVYNSPEMSSPQVATYYPGESFKYDSYTKYGKHIWLSYVSRSGVRRYVPSSDLLSNGKRGEVYGVFD